MAMSLTSGNRVDRSMGPMNSVTMSETVSWCESRSKTIPPILFSRSEASKITFVHMPLRVFSIIRGIPSPLVLNDTERRFPQ